MDAERQGGRNKDELTLSGLRDHVKQKAKEPTASTTLIIFFILNLIMLIVGFIHLNHCHIRRMIPIYLIVAGLVGIISKVLPFINRKLDLKLITYVIYAMFVFEIIWMFLGSYWVYRTSPKFDDKRSALYCDKTAYYLAFWLLTVNWILIALAGICMCCAMICVAVMQ